MIWWMMTLATGCSKAQFVDTQEPELCPESEQSYEDLPDLLGNWTVSFAQTYFDEDCGLSSLDRESESWIINTTMEVRGLIPDELYVELDGEPFWGAVSPAGGVSFAGQRDSEHGPMTATFGGLLYHEGYRYDRPVIEGYAYLGLDTLNDGLIDCGARGDFLAIRSGD